MIAIVNISPENTPAHGVNQYALKHNRRVLCYFEHNRTAFSDIQLLRDAADALEKVRVESNDRYFNPELRLVG